MKFTPADLQAYVDSLPRPGGPPGVPEYPAGLSRRSWLYHQRYPNGNPHRRLLRRPEDGVQPPKIQPPPSYFHPVHAEPPEVIAAMPALTPTQSKLLGRLHREGGVVMSGKTARRTIEALVRRGLATYETEHVLNETHRHYFYRFTVRPKEFS